MSTGLQTTPARSFDDMQREAHVLCESGLLPDYINNEYRGNPKKAIAKTIAIMMKGNELGLPAWVSLAKIHVIQGKPTVSPELMLALIQRSGLLADFNISEQTNERCVIKAQRGGHTAHAVSFTFQEAVDMKLASKDNWRKQPSVMLMWRCVSRWARLYFADVVSGLYTPEELAPDMSYTASGEVEHTTAADEFIEGDITDTPRPADVDYPTPEAPDEVYGAINEMVDNRRAYYRDAPTPSFNSKMFHANGIAGLFKSKAERYAFCGMVFDGVESSSDMDSAQRKTLAYLTQRDDRRVWVESVIRDYNEINSDNPIE